MDIKALDERLISNLESFEESLTVFDELQNDVEKMNNIIKEKNKTLDDIKMKYKEEVQAYREKLEYLNVQVKEKLSAADHDREKIWKESQEVLSSITLKNQCLDERVEETLIKLNNIISEELDKFTQNLSSLDEKTAEGIGSLTTHIKELNRIMVENINDEISSIKVKVFNIIEDAKRESLKVKSIIEGTEILKDDIQASNKQIEDLKKVSHNQNLQIIYLENKLKKNNQTQWILFIVSIILIVIMKFI